MARFSLQSPRVRNYLITFLVILLIVAYSVYKSRVTEGLLQGLASPEEQIRQTAALSLLASDNLINATLDEPEWIRLNACNALAKAEPNERTLDTLVKFCKDPSLRVRTAAGLTWGSFGMEALERSVKELGSGDANVRLQAVEAIKKIGSGAASQTLMAYKDSFEQDPIDWNQRIAAAQALGGLKAEKAVKELIAGLKDQNATARVTARDSLVAIGVPSVEPLLAILEDGDPPQPQYAAYCLGMIKITPPAPVVEEVAEEEEEEAATDAVATDSTTTAAEEEEVQATEGEVEVASEPADAEAEAAAEEEEEEEVVAAAPAPEPYVPEVIFQKAVPALLVALNRDDIATTVAAALGNIADKRAVAPLISSLARPAEIAAAAASALGKLADQRAVMPLINALHSDTEWVAEAAGLALTQLGKPSVTPLMAMTGEAQGEIRQRAIKALAEMNDPTLSGVFISHLKDPAASVRLQCARALGMLRPNSAVPALVAVLADPDWHVSYAARDALVYIGTPAVTALIGAMSSDNPRTRLYAQQALVGVGDGAVEPAIKALASQNTATRLGAVIVLGELGGQRAVKALQTLDKDPNETVRNQVSRALSTIGT